MQYKEEIEMIRNMMLKEKKQCDHAMRRAPLGILHVAKNGNYLSCRQVSVRNGVRCQKMIGKDKDLVRVLAEKEFYATKSLLLQKDIEILETAVGALNEMGFQTVFENMKNGVSRLPKEMFFDAANNGLLIPHPTQDTSVPIEPVSSRIVNMTVEEWAVQPYRENTSHLEHKVQKGHYGLTYRSRHELICCERLLQRGKAFHYDQVIELPDGLASPDIILPDRLGELSFIEIAGLNTEAYINDLNEKIMRYEDSGIMLGRNLVIIRPEENGAIDLNKFDRIVDAFS